MDVAAEAVQPGTELEESAQEEFGFHFVEILLLQGAFDAGKTTGELLELFFKGREVPFLEPFDVDTFYDVDSAVGFAV